MTGKQLQSSAEKTAVNMKYPSEFVKRVYICREESIFAFEVFALEVCCFRNNTVCEASEAS